MDYFKKFWEIYPRKVAVGYAEQTWNKIKPSPALALEIIEALKKQLPHMSQQEKQYIPHASTWLNQKRWMDEVEEEETVVQMVQRKWGKNG